VVEPSVGIDSNQLVLQHQQSINVTVHIQGNPIHTEQPFRFAIEISSNDRRFTRRTIRHDRYVDERTPACVRHEKVPFPKSNTISPQILSAVQPANQIMFEPYFGRDRSARWDSPDSTQGRITGKEVTLLVEGKAVGNDHIFRSRQPFCATFTGQCGKPLHWHHPDLGRQSKHCRAGQQPAQQELDRQGTQQGPLFRFRRG
jgi:hypothetical protein